MYNTLAEIVTDLHKTNSRLRKEKILAEVMCHDSLVCQVFVHLVRRAFDTYETFGVKKVSQVYHDNGVSLSNDWLIVNDLLDKLASRELTGNKALDAIEEVSHTVDDVEWNVFYSAVLMKDLKCGVNITTWNKVAAKIDKALMVDVFSCQLAKDGAKEKEIVGEKLVEVKLDGVRVITIVHPDGTVMMHSRNGKPLTNFPKIADQFKDWAKSLNMTGAMVFDGEVMSSSFQDLMKQVHRKDDVQTDDAVLYIFDLIPFDEFKSGYCDTPQGVRSSFLAQHFHTAKRKGLFDNVEIVQQEIVNLNTDRGRARLVEINRAAVEGGYEGIMLKDIRAHYETKRTKSWLKIKPFIEVTLEVVDIEEGTGKNTGATGALVCRGVDTGREISVNVGSGLSDDLRTNIWLNKQNVIGQLVEVRADAITQNQDGTYSLRFPRFKSFRGFEPGEKL